MKLSGVFGLIGTGFIALFTYTNLQTEHINMLLLVPTIAIAVVSIVLSLTGR